MAARLAGFIFIVELAVCGALLRLVSPAHWAAVVEAEVELEVEVGG